MKNLQKPKHHRKIHGFTLVELIVVVTILIILGTIAFTSLQGYSSFARDSSRISSLSNLQKGLNLFQIKSGTYPMPEGKVDITASGTVIGYQGSAKDQISGIAKLSQGGTIDPLDATIYTTYSVNFDRTKMQLMAFLEDGNTITAFIPKAFASTASDYSKRSPTTTGDTLGILLASGSLQPLQESGMGVDVVDTNSGYLAIFGNKVSDKVSGTGTLLITAIATYSPDGKNISKYDKNLLGYWDMETMAPDGKLKDLSMYGKNGNMIGTKSISGKMNLARSFNGNDDVVRIVSANLNFTTNGNFSLSVWLKPNTFLSKGGWRQEIMSQGHYLVSGYRFGISHLSGIPLFWNTQEGGTLYLAGSTSVLLNQWNHLVVTYSNQNSHMYLNGRNVGSASGAYIAETNTTNIGGGYWDAFSGSIDEVRIYNRALGDSEIQALYSTVK